jgi:hypothetical protein
MNYEVVFFMPDTSAMGWTSTVSRPASNAADARAQATESFDDVGDGPIAGMTSSMRDLAKWTGTAWSVMDWDTETPPEGVYLVQVTPPE